MVRLIVAAAGAAVAAFDDVATVQAMLDVELALARAQARCGVIPKAAVPPIEAACKAQGFDFDALARDAMVAGNLAIPLVTQLTARVARIDADAARYVHWGATSQDIIDSALALQLRTALGPLDADLSASLAALARLADRYRATPMVARTLLQPALPTTFGLKAAGWLDALLRVSAGLALARAAAQVLQFGGAAGTLASLGAQGMRVAEALAIELRLPLPTIPWHAQRDRIAQLGAALGLLTGTLGKIARDISLLAQAEVAELAEPTAPGRGVSSTLPQKRNPIGCAAALAAAIRVPPLVATLLSAMVQEHERALGGWQAEWGTLPQIVELARASSAQMRIVLEGLHVDAGKMRANLDAGAGVLLAEAVSLALAAQLGRGLAKSRIEAAVQRAHEIGFRAALLADPAITDHLDPRRIDALLDPANYLGAAGEFVDDVLHDYRRAISG